MPMAWRFLQAEERVCTKRGVVMGHSPGFERLVETRRSRIRECRPSEVMARLERGDSFYFIDVREDHEVAQGLAHGATHKGRGILERDVEQMISDKNAEIILCCGGGYRSALSAANLQEMGYTRVFSMAGGIKAWQQAGYPLWPGPAS